jgi:hypothetical protein
MNQFDKVHLYVKGGLDDQNRHKLKLSISYMQKIQLKYLKKKYAKQLSDYDEN